MTRAAQVDPSDPSLWCNGFPDDLFAGMLHWGIAELAISLSARR